MTNKPYSIEDLPELPLETLAHAGDLEPSGTAPVLTIRPKKRPAPKPPATPAALVPKPESCVRKYLAQVLYPRTICYPITEVPDKVALHPAPKEEERHDMEATARREMFYKLTSYRGAKLKIPNLCTVKHGPWSAVVIEQESCTLGFPSEFTLFIVEMPEVEMSWFGEWEDIPPYPDLQVIMGSLHQIEEACNCCPGHTWCPTTGSCLPNSIPCKINPPPV